MKIHTIGGYNEVGKNMTALEIGEDVFVFDLGLFMPAIMGVQEKEKIPTERGMRSLGALPDDFYLKDKNLAHKVRAFLISHAHLDHVGALPYLSHNYRADIFGTQFTIEVLKTLMNDNNQSMPNRTIPLKPDTTLKIRGRNRVYDVEFINMTHSTLQTSVIAVHTPEGIVMYANDFKLDNTPILGEKPNYKRLKELSKIGVKALILDCLYAPDDRKTPSEKIARGLLEDVFFTTDNRNSGMVVTTFSSHIARLKTITEFGRRLNREVVFVGRSLNKYTTAASNIGKAPFKKDIKIFTYRKQLEKMLKKMNHQKRNYLLVCTGHQGEPGSVLERMSKNELPYKIGANDQVIFSSKTIPSPLNELTKDKMIKRIKKHQARIFDNVHVSGHGGREDLRDLIRLVNPEHVIPSHGDAKKRLAGARLAEEMGYKFNKTVHMMQNLKHLVLK